MRYPIMKRLRVPASLVVAFVGSATCVSLYTGGCETTTDPIDAGHLQQTRPDGPGRDGTMEPPDVGPDARSDPDPEPADAGLPDTPIV